KGGICRAEGNEKGKLSTEVAAPFPLLRSPLGFSFSPAGLLGPYHLGVLSLLCEANVINQYTPVAGASAGGLAAAAVGLNLSAATVMSSVEHVCRDLIDRGTAHRLGKRLRKELNKLIPEDCAEIIAKRPGRVTVTYTHVFPYMQGEFVSSFLGKSDMIDCLIASCNIPFYLTKWPTVTCRGRQCVDGFFATKHKAFGCPDSGALRDIKVVPFYASTIRVSAAPQDCINPDLQLQDAQIVHYLRAKALLRARARLFREQMAKKNPQTESESSKALQSSPAHAAPRPDASRVPLPAVCPLHGAGRIGLLDRSEEEKEETVHASHRSGSASPKGRCVGKQPAFLPSSVPHSDPGPSPVASPKTATSLALACHHAASSSSSSSSSSSASRASQQGSSLGASWSLVSRVNRSPRSSVSAFPAAAKLAERRGRCAFDSIYACPVCSPLGEVCPPHHFAYYFHDPRLRSFGTGVITTSAALADPENVASLASLSSKSRGQSKKGSSASASHADTAKSASGNVEENRSQAGGAAAQELRREKVDEKLEGNFEGVWDEKVQENLDFLGDSFLGEQKEESRKQSGAEAERGSALQLGFQDGGESREKKKQRSWPPEGAALRGEQRAERGDPLKTMAEAATVSGAVKTAREDAAEKSARSADSSEAQKEEPVFADVFSTFADHLYRAQEEEEAQEKGDASQDKVDNERREEGDQDAEKGRGKGGTDSSSASAVDGAQAKTVTQSLSTAVGVGSEERTGVFLDRSTARQRRRVRECRDRGCLCMREGCGCSTLPPLLRLCCSTQELLQIALEASPQETLRELFDVGRADAFRWLVLEYIRCEDRLIEQAMAAEKAARELEEGKPSSPPPSSSSAARAPAKRSLMANRLRERWDSVSSSWGGSASSTTSVDSLVSSSSSLFAKHMFSLGEALLGGDRDAAGADPAAEQLKEKTAGQLAETPGQAVGEAGSAKRERSEDARHETAAVPAAALKEGGGEACGGGGSVSASAVFLASQNEAEKHEREATALRVAEDNAAVYGHGSVSGIVSAQAEENDFLSLVDESVRRSKSGPPTPGLAPSLQSCQETGKSQRVETETGESDDSALLHHNAGGLSGGSSPHAMLAMLDKCPLEMQYSHIYTHSHSWNGDGSRCMQPAAHVQPVALTRRASRRNSAHDKDRHNEGDTEKHTEKDKHHGREKHREKDKHQEREKYHEREKHNGIRLHTLSRSLSGAGNVMPAPEQESISSHHVHAPI
ncbi:phospholipase, patatin family protein, partial [Toxoplasma gondii p89]